MRNIELLAPARNAIIGIEAIRHGADAVYIGGPSFGARAAAGNSVQDIRQLCEYAHIFGARVYVTLNTILYDDELEAVEQTVQELYEAGVDALITQDLAMLSLNLPPIALHASTQMDNCTPEKAKFLEAAGYSQIVLARELSLAQIREIHAATTLPLEAFVHGALCVSYSGRCYASEYCFGRSANRGKCAQFCRLAFDLVDADNKTLMTQQHLLSLRDMNRSSAIEEMLDAGISSFKIEGRLKDVSYVKNVTAQYRIIIDEIIRRRPEEFCRSSRGTTRLSFTPRLEKSFNRGFTDYFLHGRKQEMWNFISPKSTGECVGVVRNVRKKSFVISYFHADNYSDDAAVRKGAVAVRKSAVAVRKGNVAVSKGDVAVRKGADMVVRNNDDTAVHNGDGIVFVNNQGNFDGVRVNRVEGNEIFPLKMPAIGPGTVIFRNEDRVWESILEKNSAERTIPINIILSEGARGYTASASVDGASWVTCTVEAEIQDAAKPQRDNIIRNLTKLGRTPFSAGDVVIKTQGERFIPASLLSQLRRLLVDRLIQSLQSQHMENRELRAKAADHVFPDLHVPFTCNVSNKVARNYLLAHGVKTIEPALEVQTRSQQKDSKQMALMACRHCLRYALGQCPKETGKRPSWREPVSLRLSDGRTFPLRFDCSRCEMQVMSPKK